MPTNSGLILLPAVIFQLIMERPLQIIFGTPYIPMVLSHSGVHLIELVAYLTILRETNLLTFVTCLLDETKNVWVPTLQYSRTFHYSVRQHHLCEEATTNY